MRLRSPRLGKGGGRLKCNELSGTLTRVIPECNCLPLAIYKRQCFTLNHSSKVLRTILLFSWGFFYLVCITDTIIDVVISPLLLTSSSSHPASPCPHHTLPVRTGQACVFFGCALPLLSLSPRPAPPTAVCLSMCVCLWSYFVHQCIWITASHVYEIAYATCHSLTGLFHLA